MEDGKKTDLIKIIDNSTKDMHGGIPLPQVVDNSLKKP